MKRYIYSFVILFSLLFLCGASPKISKEKMPSTEKPRLKTPFEKFLSELEQKEDSIQDFSCRLIQDVGESEFLKAFEQVAGKPLPRTFESTIWFKKPNKIKIEQKGEQGNMRVLDVQQSGWSFLCPTPQCIVWRIRQSYPPSSKNYECTVKSKNVFGEMSHIIICTRDYGLISALVKGLDPEAKGQKDQKLKDVFYIHASNGMAYQFASYLDEKMVSSLEWKDFEINKGIVDDVFEIHPPSDSAL